MAYSVKEMFYTLQGEGANAGTAAVFCRFAGCNLWSGREQHRAFATCRFCDTDFVGTNGTGGGKFTTATSLADAVLSLWPTSSLSHRFTVITGGEPALQLDDALIDALHARKFRVAVETNGTLPLPNGIDWVCVSPKAGTVLTTTRGHELKLVYPQKGAAPESFQELEFQSFFIQPMDGPDKNANTERAIEYCLRHPKWRLSVQTHKIVGLR